MSKSKRKTPTAPGDTILLVEDDVDLSAITAAHLQDAGFQVKPARTAAAALDILHGPEPIDAVFTDVVLPSGLNGFELARAVRDEFPELPVLLATGFGVAVQIAEIREIETVAKPYDAGAVAMRLGQLIAQRRAAARDESAAGEERE